VRRIVVIACSFAALLLTGSAVAAHHPGTPGAHRPPQFPHIAGNWSHAELNVTIAGVPHTLILDRGKIRSVRATSLKLVRRDGTSETIQLASSTSITLDGTPAAAVELQRGMSVQTMRIDGGPAVQVRASTH
jgi:hypothetical protein